MCALSHEPVLLNEVLDIVKPASGKLYLDGTLGGGGHAKSILEASAPEGKLIGVDRDQRACERVEKRLEDFADRMEIVHADYRDYSGLHDGRPLHGILLDLGISSFHLDDPLAGFSFQQDGPLDMRMDQSQQITAASIVNSGSEKELAEIIYKWGEDRFSRKIAARIVEHRKQEQFESTLQLANVISAAIPRRFHPRHHHPATRTFQALRIAVNRELERLDEAITDLAHLLAVGGMMAVISFHSLEDRIVKWAMRSLAGMGRKKEIRIVMQPEQEELPEFELVTRKPILASEEEQERNHRSRSAKLRAITRVRG